MWLLDEKPRINSSCLHKYLQHPEIRSESTCKLLIAADFEFPHRSAAFILLIHWQRGMLARWHRAAIIDNRIRTGDLVCDAVQAFRRATVATFSSCKNVVTILIYNDLLRLNVKHLANIEISNICPTLKCTKPGNGKTWQVWTGECQMAIERDFFLKGFLHLRRIGFSLSDWDVLVSPALFHNSYLETAAILNPRGCRAEEEQ